MRASLQPFFQPRSVAVVGASKRRGSIGGELFRNILTGGFTGSVYPVNRNSDPVGAVHGYCAVDAIPEVIDLAVICLPGEQVLAAAEEALVAGVRALVVISAGFAETGSEGAERQAQLLALVRDARRTPTRPELSRHRLLVGSPQRDLRAHAASQPARSASPRRAARSASPCSSGLRRAALASPRSSRSATRQTSRRTTCSSGGRTTTRPSSSSSTWSPSATPRSSRASPAGVARRKPILALKGGTTRAGIRAAGSHTAALAGSDAAADALFAQAGVIRARTLDELIDVASLLSAQPVPPGRAPRSSRTPGDWESSPPTPASHSASSCPPRATRHAPHSPPSCRRKVAPGTRSTSSAARTQRASSKRSLPFSPIRVRRRDRPLRSHGRNRRGGGRRRDQPGGGHDRGQAGPLRVPQRQGRSDLAAQRRAGVVLRLSRGGR